MMNGFAADPHWGWWIVWYFFLGGIAAGAYFVATLVDLAGHSEDRRVARAGYLIAFPLIVLCGVFLIADLSRPDRFWHMLLRSAAVNEALAAGWPLTTEGWRPMARAPLLKYWSPMSIGSWAITLFGLCSFVTFVAALRPGGLTARMLARGWIGGPLRLLGCGVGFFVAAYTGALLTATNQPLWSDSPWIASLFLTSAASTGIAMIVLLTRLGGQRDQETFARLERADRWALVLELAVFVAFLASLGSLLLPVLATTGGKLLVFGVLVIGLLAPLVIHLRARQSRATGAIVAAVFVLVGGFLMRYAMLTTPRDLIAAPQHTAEQSTPWSSFHGPEADRARGNPGGDAGNRPANLEPRSKILGATKHAAP